MSHTGKVFLTAEWRDLVMLNYEIDPALLRGFVPQGTELDSFAGKTYVSLVGFRFCGTKYLGRFPLPFHSEFEEINLRFYVRRKVAGEIRRGVVFIAEIVPKLAIAKVARWVYGENYVCRRMQQSSMKDGQGRILEYGWKGLAGWCSLRARIEGAPSLPSEGSAQQFITEHYWGYSRQRGGRSFEYHVAHEPWHVWAASQAEFVGNAFDLYGKPFAETISHPPSSTFVAEGSAVSVFTGAVLE
jgi:uncharacterized protein YqjF (DUF2071 family)